ncbi:MAG: hypothetical protein IIZ92_12625 [Aquincola sp.]|nr:hypothetical protein [Aquincola sp.]|tara:strand:+ start:2569 stop:3243 length:675 start_codon:yes stop_codon:yes gene_type:complete
MPSTFVKSSLADLAPSTLVHPPSHALVLRVKGTSNFVRVREGVKAVGDVVRDAPSDMEFEVGFVPIPMKANGEPRRNNLGTPEQMMARWVPLSDAVGQEPSKDEVAAREAARADVLRRIELRTLQEAPEMPGDKGRSALIGLALLAAMQTVVTVAHVEFSWPLAAVMVGVPTLAWWHLSSSYDAAEQRAARRRVQIADEEWSRAGARSGAADERGRNLADRAVL